MLGENKNLKDTSKDSIKDTSSATVSLTPFGQDHFRYYNKINKLITALYMVTDTMDKEEPIRLKLRTLGVEILSDITSLGALNNLSERITVILSFLNIASDIRMISEMNCNILKKEFADLRQSIQGLTTQNNLWFEEFVKTSSPAKGRNEEGSDPLVFQTLPLSKGRENSKGQGARIGVQKGSTLLKALSNKVSTMSDKNNPAPYEAEGFHSGFEVLKNKRREEIIAIIKERKNSSGVDGATITDIKNGARGIIVSCGEKTLQRELISMVKDNVLKKTGEKRWSQYFLG